MWEALGRFYQRHFWELPEACLAALETRLRPGMRTLETGSGRSTRLFEAKGCLHTALEHDSAHAPSLRSVVVAPLTGEPPWYDWRPQHRYDLILIDGPPFWIGRNGVLRVLPECMTPESVVILDDTQRRAERRLADDIAARYDLEVAHHASWELGFYRRGFSVLSPRRPR